MGLGVVRMEASREPPSAALVDHVAGRTRPPSALLREHLGIPFEVLEEDAHSFAVACVRARELASEKRGGRAPSLGVSWIFAGGPDTDDVHRDASTIPDDAPATLAEGRPWTLADCHEYARECQALLEEAMPGEARVVALHLDEKAVHVQAEMPALVGDRVGNKTVRESMARLAPGFAKQNVRARKKLAEREAKTAHRDEAERAAGRKPKRRRRWVDKGSAHCYLDHHAQLRLIHDVYAERVARFGIVRAKGGARRHHERVDRSKAMDARAASVQREIERSEALAKAAKDRADQLIEECNQESDRVVERVAEAVLTEHRVAEAKARHQELETAYKDKRRQLRRRLAQDLKRQRGLDAAERDRLTRERGEQEDELRTLRAQAAQARKELAALRQQREDDEALGSRGLAGSRARRGRELRVAHEAEVATLTTVRDEVRAALEESQADGRLAWREVLRMTKRAETAERERDELQRKIPSPEQEELGRMQRQEMRDREVASARFLGLKEGLGIAGGALAQCVEASGHREPGMERLVGALTEQDVAKVDELASHRRAPGRSQGAAERPGGWERPD